ncbi:hypothetical protein HYH03_018720, partial [Edaphochlamys debaryana]
MRVIETAGGREPDNWFWRLHVSRRRFVITLFGKKRSKRMESALTGAVWMLFTVLLTLFALYAVDITDAAVGSTTARTVISGCLLFCFAAFIVDLVASGLFVDKYLFSFFFWLDIIGTASLVLGYT